MICVRVGVGKSLKNVMDNKEKAQARLLKAGYSLIYEYDDPPNEEFPDHIHEGEELAIILSGTLEVKMGGVEYLLKPGDELLFPAKKLHSAMVGPDGCVYVVGEKNSVKKLKFRPHLVKEIREGKKTATWRLFDDKDLRIGDKLELVESESGEKFAEAEITKIREKKLGEIEESDFVGHETYSGPEAMLQSYREYYGDRVTMDAPIKMIDFKVLRFL